MHLQNPTMTEVILVMNRDLCRYQDEEFILWSGSDSSYGAIVDYIQEWGISPDYGRGTDAYRALTIALLIKDGQLYLDRIRVTTVGDRYPKIGDVAPEFPHDPRRFAIYSGLNTPIKISGRLTLLKDQTYSMPCVSGWFSPSDFAVNIELEFVAGRLVDRMVSPDQLRDQRNRAALKEIEQISKANWKELEKFMLYWQAIEKPTTINKWSQGQIAMVKEAAASGVREAIAFELLGIIQKKASDFVDAMTPLQDADVEMVPRRDALRLMTSDPDLARKQFMSVDMPVNHVEIAFADIDKVVTEGPGIYQIWTFGGEALKVGIGTNLRDRLRKHRASRASGLRLRPGGDPDNPDHWVSKASILAKHLYFDQSLTQDFDLTTEGDRRRFLDECCRITFIPTVSKQEARELEKVLEVPPGRFRYQGRVRRR